MSAISRAGAPMNLREIAVSDLRRVLGLPMLLFYGVGVIVGAGIYSILGAAAGIAGADVWLSLLIGAIPALLVGLCYAELATMIPRAGGSYVYVHAALPRLPIAGFVTGFLVAATAMATAATVAAAFGGYLQQFLALPGWVGALALMLVCTLLNIAGIREAAWFAVICTLIEVAGLVLIIGAGMRFGLRPAPLETGPGPVLAAAALSFFVYTGFEGLANLAEETRKPERNLPIAIVASLLFTTLLYVLVALAAVTLVSPGELASSDAPLAAAAATAGPRLATALTWVALFSTANTALITVVVASRTLLAMGEEADLPPILARVWRARGSPWVAAIVMGAGSALFLPLGGVAVLGSVASLTTLTVFIAVCTALTLLRRQGKAGKFRAALEVRGVPITPIVAVAGTVLLMTQFEPVAYAAGAGTIVLGVAAYAARKWWRHESGGLKEEPA